MMMTGREKDFGQPLTDEENKETQLGILKYVDRYCTEHGLRYFLADGTLIGAIRHRGYIPWDDDIDIRMPRPDYNKLMKSFNADVGDNHFKLIAPTSAEAQHYFVKIIDTRTIKIEPYLNYKNGYLGVDIDVFPLDGCPEGEHEFLKWANEIREYNKAFVYKKKQWLRSILGRGKDITAHRVKAKFVPFMTCNEIVDKVSKTMMQYPFDRSKYVCGVGVVDRFRIPYDCVKDYIIVPFEDSAFRVPVGYDAMLTAQYGDYMKLPPVEQRVSHHVNNVYWIK